MPVTNVVASGTVLKRHYSNSSPIFLPLKEAGDKLPFAVPSLVAGRKPYVAPDKNIFAGRLYVAATWVHGLGVTPQQFLENTREGIKVAGSKVSRDDSETKDMLLKVNDYEREFKFTSNFTRYWAKKKNKTWI